MAAAIPYMAAGYVADRALGGNGMTGLTIGSLGAGAAGGFTMPSFSGSLGTGATAANSLGGGTALMGGASTAVGTGASSGAATGILGSSTNAIPSYDIGMEGLKSNIGGFTAPVEQSLVNANAYQPLNSGIAPDMSFKQSYINTTPEQGMGNLGVPQTPDNVGSISTSDISKQGLNNQAAAGYTDGVANQVRPDFANITKSSEKQIAAAQGGYSKPLYEKAFDSVMGYAEKNPLGVAALGMSVMGGGSGDGSATQGYAPSGGVSRQAYNQNKDRIMKIRRA